MPLANNALVLVTDGRKTLFFRNHGDENQIDLRTEAFDEREDAARPRAEDRRRRVQSSSLAASADPRYEETDFHQLEEDRWAHAAAEAGQQARASGMISTRWRSSRRPRRSALIRKKLHKEAERRLVCEIPKEMTGRPIPDIEALIVGETKAEAPRPFLGE